MDYLIEYQSSQWCGGNSYVIVRDVDSADAAVLKAEEHMASTMMELFSDEYHEDDGSEYDDECPYTVDSVEVFDEKNEHWEFYKKSNYYYPEV